MRTLLALVLLASSFPLTAAEPVFTIPFEAYRNQVWLRWSVNGRGPVWVLFDSAAGGSTIDRDLIDRFDLGGLQFAEATSGGAGPEQLRVPVFRDITFGFKDFRHTPENLPAIPHERMDKWFGRRIDAIVGKDLMRRYVVEIDSVDHVMRLYEPASFEYRGTGAVIPVKIADGPIFEAAIRIAPGRKVPCRLMIDSGGSMAMVFTKPFAGGHGLKDAIGPIRKGVGGGIGGDEETAVGRIESVEIGPYSMPQPVVSLSLARGGSFARTDFDSIIGMEVIRRFKMILDYSRKRVTFEPNAALREPVEWDMSGLMLNATGPALDRLVVRLVTPDSPASAAGLREKDRVVSIDGRKPATLGDAQEALRSRPGRVVRLGMERDGKAFEVKITLRRLT